MISLELAKKLKEAGLPWEPKKGDWYRELSHERLTQIYDANPVYEYKVKKAIWLPRLDQLLADIKKRGWDATLHLSGNAVVLRDRINGVAIEYFRADSLVDATAQALLWILEQKQATD